MSNLNRAREIADELQKSKRWREQGGLAVGVGAAILAAIPVVGGTASVIADKVGSALLDAGLADKVAELGALVAALEPSISGIGELDAQVAQIAATVHANSSLLARLTAIVAALEAPLRAQNAFRVETDAATQSFVNVSIANLAVIAEARNGGSNYFFGVHSYGPGVTFNASSGGHQHVQSSTFSGPAGSVGMNKLTLQGRVTTGSGPGGGYGVGLGPGGSISFGPGGSLSFGGPKKPGDQK